MEKKRASQTILLVDDEEPLRHILIELLAPSGYLVLGAASGVAALDLARSHHGKIDVLVTDVLMPDLPGPELAATLQAERPGMKVIFVSGEPSCESNLLPNAPILMKPFTAKMLLAKLRQVLGTE